MIVTRQRKQKKSSLPILLPIAAIAMLVFALSWPPSRNVIANGPLRPVAETLGNVWATVSRPLTFAYQQQQITDRNVEIKQLNDKLETDRKTAADKDAQVASLQKQINALQNAPADASAATPAPAAAASAAPGAAVPGAAVAAPADESVRRTAQQWSAMDPEKAAALAQKLPDAEVAAIFAQMSADNVGPILDALPPAVAARIVQAGGPNPPAPSPLPSGRTQISAQPGR